MFWRLMSHLQEELPTHVVINVSIVLSVHKNVLPEDGAILAETRSRFDNNTYSLLYVFIC
jgi:hypothetical protein